MAAAIGSYSGYNIQKNIESLDRDRDAKTLADLSPEEYMRNRDPVVTQFVRSATEKISPARQSDEARQKTEVCRLSAIDSIYRARNLNYISPVSFKAGALMYSVTSSKMGCELFGSMTACGSYKTHLN